MCERGRIGANIHHTVGSAKMGIERILSLIENYGLTLLAVVLLVAWIRPKADEAWGVLIARAKRPEQAPAPKEDSLSVKVERGKELASQVQRYIQSMMGDFRADRVYVFQYHNGGRGVGNIDFIKISCSYEVVSLGTSPQQQWLQRMPITLCWAFIRLIDSGIGVFCPDIEECFYNTDASTYETLARQGVKSVYCVGLYSDTRAPLGFIGVDYCSVHREWSAEEKTKLQIHAERVSAMLCAAGHESCMMRRAEDVE